MIKILIDSASDISREEAEKLGVTVVPMIINFGEEEFYDGVNLSPAEFYEKLVEGSVMPKTSLVNAFRWEEEIEKHLKENDELLIITISSKLSGTYQSAVSASEKYGDKVMVLDSLNACIGERLVCLHALELINQGLSLKEVHSALEDKKLKVKVFALLGTLEYLKRGGRISSALAFAGEMIALKPIVGVISGEVKLIAKALGTRKGDILLNKLIDDTNGIDFDLPFGTFWTGLDTTHLDKYVSDSKAVWSGNDVKVEKYILGATVGTHLGPGAIGVAYFEK